MAYPFALKLGCFLFVATAMWLSIRLTGKSYEPPEEPGTTLDPNRPR